MADPDRKGGGGLSLRTLAIASAASLTAAMVTSRLFPPGTIYASALTPVLVAAVSELLNRPADRVSELRRQRRTLVMEVRELEHEARELETATILGEEASPLRGAPEIARGAAAEPPARAHARRSRRTQRGPRRLLHPKVWIATGLVAFVIAAAALTLPELIFGGAVATSHRTTLFGGGSSGRQATTPTTTTTTETQPTTVTQTVPAQTPTTTTQTDTQTTTTGTGTSTQPSGGTPAPSGDTSTTTTPSGSVAPPLP